MTPILQVEKLRPGCIGHSVRKGLWWEGTPDPRDYSHSPPLP